MPKPVAKIYFVRGHEEVVNDLAARIRNEGNLCHLVYAGNVRDEGDLESGANAIAIQKSSQKALLIGKLYRAHFPNTEIHYFDDNGEFCDAPDDPSQAKADPFASLKAKPAATAATSAPVAEEPEPNDTGPAEESAPVTEQPAD